MSAAARARDRATLEAFAGPHVTIPIALIRRLGGDLDAAAFLQLAAFLSSIVKKKDGFFFLPQDDSRAPNKDDAPSIFVELKSFRAALGLSPEAQLAARKKLKRLGLLQEELRGIPAQLHYRVDASALLDFLAEEDAAPPVPAKAGTRTRKSGNKNRQNRELKRKKKKTKKDFCMHATRASARNPPPGAAVQCKCSRKKMWGGKARHALRRCVTACRAGLRVTWKRSASWFPSTARRRSSSQQKKSLRRALPRSPAWFSTPCRKV